MLTNTTTSALRPPASRPQSASLSLQNVVLAVAGRRLLHVNHTIEAGEVLSVMGESGSGKSSLLNLISGFLPPDFEVRGHVLLGGRPLLGLPPHKRRIGLLFQTPHLFPHLSTGGNLLAGLKPEGARRWPLLPSRRERSRRRQIAEEALSAIGLDGFFERDPATLSGGQQTRVALMRLLLSKPQALLLDEPFSSLDRALRQDIRSLTFQLAREQGLPVLLVTHDPDDATAAGGAILDLGRDA